MVAKLKSAIKKLAYWENFFLVSPKIVEMLIFGKVNTKFYFDLTFTAADPRANQPSGWRGFKFRANFLQQAQKY